MGRKISLTVDERVILHLMDFIPHEEDFEAPEGTTQAGIARAVDIERKHVPRAVNKLIDQAFLTTRVSHVKGSKQRKKVYFLTFEGKAYARKLWRSLASKEVKMIDEDGTTKKTTFSELCFTHQVDKSPVKILVELDDENVFDPKKVQRRRKEKKKKIQGLDDKGAKEVYKKALTKAWEDRILTRDEAEMLRELRMALGVSEDEHKGMQEDILGDQKYDSLNREGLYKEILQVALKDGVITSDERDILDELKRILGIELDINTESIIDENSSVEEGENLLEEYAKIYKSVLAETMRDGKITKDEENVILLLKRMLNIDDGDHIKLMKDISKENGEKGKS